MRNQEPSEHKEGRSYRVLLLLLVALAVLSSAMKDLDRLQQFTAQLHEMAMSWPSGNLFTASAAPLPISESACSVKDQQDPRAEEFRWSGRIESGKAIEIKGISGDIEAEAATGDAVEVVAHKRSSRGDLSRVNIKVVEHPGGVLICAVYQSEDGTAMTPCEVGDGEHKRDRSGTFNIKNDNVGVDFKVRVPAGVDFVGRTVNGGISATLLASNVVSRTVNGSIKISTNGYAQANTVNGEISAKLGNANWTGALEFKTINGQIELDLPAAASTTVEATTLNGEITSDFPLTLPGKIGRKQVNGTIGSGGRQLILTTLNGSINLRRIG